jgi:ribosome biogenesis GTPase / thiamine phosphate phosphatase
MVAAHLRPDEGAATIHHRLPRSTAFVRRAPETGGVQVVAANIDLAFLTLSLNAALNLRRIERYLALTLESGASPVIILTKADLCPDLPAAIALVERVAAGAPVHAVSALTGQGFAPLDSCLRHGHTAVLLGSSGAGKSTLVNALAGAPLMATAAIREDDARGRHTTTHRELILLPAGGVVLDTPGMRELGLWDAEAGLASAFAEIEALAAHCRFHNCAHGVEPGCAVRGALEAGDLDPGRWRGYLKLQRELAHLDRRDNPVAAALNRKVWIARQNANRARQKHRERWS